MDGIEPRLTREIAYKLDLLIHAWASQQQRDDDLAINLARVLTVLTRPRRSTRLTDHEFKVFSQWGEDGILQHLVAEVPIAHRTFIEFGVEDFFESNCRLLLMKDNWRGFVIDGSEANIARLRSSYFYWKHDLQSRAAFVTAENIDTLLASAGFDPDVGVLSIDIDGVDFWVWQAIKSVHPRIVVAEYNALFGPERIITVPYEPDFQRTRKHYSNLYYGASLAALTALAWTRGYDLVGTNSVGTNAFFVRRDVRPHTLPALTVEQAFTPCHIREMRDREGRLTYADRNEQFEAIRGLPVYNVATGEIEPL
jgi:hypothetical protein